MRFFLNFNVMKPAIRAVCGLSNKLFIANYHPIQQTMENTTPHSQPQPPYHQPQPTVIVQSPRESSNGIGTAGFVLSLLTFALGWVPVLGWILWILGLIFSAIGLAKKPRGLAIAGLIISLIDVIFITLLFGMIAAALALV